MRKVMLAAALAVSGCAPPVVTTYAVPIETPTPSRALAVRPGLQRLMSIEAAYAWCQGGRLMLVVDAFANSGGWDKGLLNPLPSSDGLRTFEAVAEPPRGYASSAVAPMRIAHDETPPYRVERVRIVSQTNQVESEIQIEPCG